MATQRLPKALNASSRLSTCHRPRRSVKRASTILPITPPNYITYKGPLPVPPTLSWNGPNVAGSAARRILDPYVNQAVSPITLRQLVFFGRNMQPDKLLKSANYVRTELPVRLAHRIRDFQNLPFIVGTNPHIERVYDLYWQAFERLRLVPEIKTMEENDRFCELVKELLDDHLVVIPQLALGIMESAKHIPPEQVDQFMSKMLRSRISRRVLAEQHISLTANYNSPNHMMTDRGYIGIIYTHCNPREIIERTALLAAETCRRQLENEQGLYCHNHQGNHNPRQNNNNNNFEHGSVTKNQDAAGFHNTKPPKVVLDGNIDAEFSYIPDHIEYILYELLKNSMRSVMLHGVPDPTTGELPPIQITICEGTNDIVFRVSDRGGGIAPSMEPDIWSYSQSATRFVNFQKVAKMAATVQEQMVSPSRSVNAAEYQDTNGITGKDYAETELELLRINEDEQRRKRKILDGSSKSGTGARPGGETTAAIELPPAPASHKAQTGDLAAVLLHRDTRTQQETLHDSNNHANQPSSASAPYLSTTSSLKLTSVIDPSQSSVPGKKAGHLDRETCQETESQQHQSIHLGIGLPMSRVYAEYWGGDLKVFTMHGYGTDAYARLCKFGNIYENFDV
ncbi:hypothetical protein BGZ96_001508 [Linnemannia gamsii]|uniref:Protein-serine/threonine kinase n=1 Tax=Linnemannia gamsii TaxID=64522 RepID=A0ABQ7JMH7_9FUNG|nr:hypothetical protein BGZ96_001508 [Linnemannia gamsii]